MSRRGRYEAVPLEDLSGPGRGADAEPDPLAAPAPLGPAASFQEQGDESRDGKRMSNPFADALDSDTSPVGHYEGDASSLQTAANIIKSYLGSGSELELERDRETERKRESEREETRTYAHTQSLGCHMLSG